MTSQNRLVLSLLRALLLSGLLLLTAAPSIGAVPNDDIPAHPDELKYPALDFEIPRGEELRHELGNGVIAYVVEDHTLPLVDVGVRLKIGSFLEPADKVGLASLVGSQMRKGGTERLAPGELDEAIDELAADLSMSVADTSGSASINCLSAQLPGCLDLFFEVMKTPRFDAARLELAKDNWLEELKQRNDDPAGIASREWDRLLYGEEHFSARDVTSKSLAAISRQDLESFHRDYWRPENMIITVSGDVDTEAVLALLKKHLGDWPAGGKAVQWPPPEAFNVPEPGLYSVQKDIPQGRVQIGHLGVKRAEWGNPEYFAIQVMNEILGGGGFSSRLMQRIRSDEGLAYSAGSFFDLANPFWQGDFAMYYQSKSESVARAAQIAFEEVARIRSEKVSQEELATAKAAFIETLPGRFDSSRSVATMFAYDEFFGRDHSYWYEYQKHVEAVSADDVLAAARKYLHPEDMVMLVVGDWEAIEKGDADGKATMKNVFDGAVKKLPLRDPLTLEPIN
jgi:predicted Zn-dependent peptidase